MSSASTHTEKRRASGCRQTTTTTPPPPSLPKKRTKKKKRDVIVRDHIDPYYIHVFSLQRFFQSSDDALYSRASRVCFTKRFSLTLSSLSLFLCLFLLPFLRRANNNNNNNNNSLFQRGDGNDKLGGDVETGRWGGNAAEIRLPSNG